MFFGKQDYSSYLQAQESECGLMCLGAASQALGSAISATELRQWFGKSTRGTSISELCDIASSLNLVATPVACEVNEVRSLQLPAILHWNGMHFCVLLKSVRKHFVVFNPVGGVQRLSHEQISGHFSGAAIQLGRGAESRTARDRPQVAWQLFFGIFKGLRRQLGVLLLLSFFLQVAALALPLMSQVAINLGAMQGNLQAVSLIAISMFSVYCANFVVDAWRARINHDIASHVHEASARHLFRHLLALPLEWFQRRRVADVISRFESVDPLRMAVSSGFATLVVDGTLGLAVALGLFFISPLLGAAVVLSVVFTAAIKAIFAPTIASRTAASAMQKVAEHAKRLETFRAVSTLKLASAEAVQERSWVEKLRRSLVSNEGAQTLTSYQQAATVLSNNIGGVVVLYVGAMMIASGSLSIGGLFAFVMYRRYLADKVGAAADQISSLWSLRYHLERISEVLDSPKEKRWNDRRVMGDYITQGAISIRQLAFRHSSSDPVFLRNVELSAEPGELILITGPSGSGKTTLLKLVAGLVTPSSGQVFIDDVALSNMSPYQLRSALAAVMQDDELFAGSVFDNVTMFSETPSLEQAIEAMQGAELWNEVKALPLGVHTPIGEGGRLISGGQRQRILLARAFYRQPKILLLDEAMANLDTFVEQRIMQYLKRHSATKLLVSHNLRLSELADRTFVLDQRGMRELGRKVAVAEAM